MIVYLTHKEIDKIKWDSCIKNSINGSVYAYSWYLDITSCGWEALIEGDYEFVFPLTNRKKYGINYLYQPYYNQQLGIFSREIIEAEKIREFFNKIPPKYRFIDIGLNISNSLHFNLPEYKKKVCKTYELELHKPYEEIYKAYSLNVKRNLKTALQNNIKIREGVSVEDLIKLKKRVSEIKLIPENYLIIRNIISGSFLNKTGIIIGGYYKNNLYAAAFFLKSFNRFIYLVSASDKDKSYKGAMAAIIDYFTKKNSEQNIILDFEGSNIDSLARYFRGFGAQPKQYLRIKYNRLPWYLRVVKK